MSKASILVVEDEPLIADDIAEALEKHGYNVVGVADNADEALELVEQEQPNVVLLDINIEGDKDGVELAAMLSIPFVFLTSYYDKQTLNRAKQVNPSGYIVKPFSEQDLVANIELALSRTPVKEVPTEQPEKFFVRQDQDIVSIQTSDILYVEAFDNYANLYTDNNKYIISHTLKSIEAKLPGGQFMRVHRSYLINFNQVDSLSEGFVYLKGNKVPIGKSYRKYFLDKITLL